MFKIFKKFLERISQHRDLFLILAWREFHIRYKQTSLGAVWAALQPLSLMVLFTIIFTFLMPIKITDYPYPIFFYSGLVFWTFFVSALNYSIPCFKNNYNLITKVNFPKESLITSGVAVALADMLIALLILFILMFLFNIAFSWSIFLVIPLTVLLIIFTLSVALLLSSLNVFYRDVGLASNFLIQAWFFATPVMYSIDKAGWTAKRIIFLNPMAFLIENLRRALIEGRGIILWQYLIMLLFAIAFFLLSYKIFLITEKKFADVI